MLLNRSRGELGGKPFAQHCSCPAVLRCSVGLTRAAFRELLSYGRIASVAQAPLVPALHQQGGNVRVAASYSDTFILHSGNASTNVALVARPWVWSKSRFCIKFPLLFIVCFHLKILALIISQVCLFVTKLPLKTEVFRGSLHLLSRKGNVVLNIF